uniref:Uncharacterized protein n=1 Tax=Parascaris equorum TaxID=6256 RepID=A0A914RTP6_PAREQ
MFPTIAVVSTKPMMKENDRNSLKTLFLVLSHTKQLHR